MGEVGADEAVDPHMGIEAVLREIDEHHGRLREVTDSVAPPARSAAEVEDPVPGADFAHLDELGRVLLARRMGAIGGLVPDLPIFLLLGDAGRVPDVGQEA
jgi:hypothetical protein